MAFRMTSATFSKGILPAEVVEETEK